MLRVHLYVRRFVRRIAGEVLGMGLLARCCSVLFVVLILLVTSRPLFAEEPAPLLRVGCLDVSDFPDDAPERLLVSYTRHYLDEISRSTGWQYQYMPMDERTAREMLRQGSIDMYFRAQQQEDRRAGHRAARLRAHVSRARAGRSCRPRGVRDVRRASPGAFSGGGRRHHRPRELQAGRREAASARGAPAGEVPRVEEAGGAVEEPQRRHPVHEAGQPELRDAAEQDVPRPGAGAARALHRDGGSLSGFCARAARRLCEQPCAVFRRAECGRRARRHLSERPADARRNDRLVL